MFRVINKDLRVNDSKLQRIAELLKISGQVHVPFIVGGLGPASQIPFLEYLLKYNSKAASDQDHIGYMLANTTPLPDRTTALKQRQSGDDSLYREIERAILAFAIHAHKQGFSSISFICNTIHAWRDELQPKMPIPWVSLMDATVQTIQEEYPQTKRIGILETDGVLITGLYTRTIRQNNLDPINLKLNSSQQNAVMDAIYNKRYGIKATGVVVSQNAVKILQSAAGYLVQQGAEVIVVGCTEIPLALNKQTYNEIHIIDPVSCLAKTLLKLAMNKSTHRLY